MLRATFDRCQTEEDLTGRHQRLLTASVLSGSLFRSRFCVAVWRRSRKLPKLSYSGWSYQELEPTAWPPLHSDWWPPDLEFEDTMDHRVCFPNSLLILTSVPSVVTHLTLLTYGYTIKVRGKFYVQFHIYIYSFHFSLKLTFVLVCIYIIYT